MGSPDRSKFSTSSTSILNGEWNSLLISLSSMYPILYVSNQILPAKIRRKHLKAEYLRGRFLFEHPQYLLLISTIDNFLKGRQQKLLRETDRDQKELIIQDSSNIGSYHYRATLCHNNGIVLSTQIDGSTKLSTHLWEVINVWVKGLIELANQLCSCILHPMDSNATSFH